MVEIRGTLSGGSGDDYLANPFPTNVIYTGLSGGDGNDYLLSYIYGSVPGVGPITIDGGDGFDIFILPDGWFGGFEFVSTETGLDIYYGDYGMIFHVVNVELIRINCFQGYYYEFFADPFFDDTSADPRSAPYWVSTFYDGDYRQYEYFTRENSVVDYNNLTGAQAGVFVIEQWLGGGYNSSRYFPDIYNAGAGDDTVWLPEEANIVLHPSVIWNYDVTFNAGSGNDTVYGSMRGDRISGGTGFDVIFGRGGDDIIYDDPFDDVGGTRFGGGIDGGGGYDTVYIGSPDRIVNANNVTVWARGDGTEYISDGRNLYAEYLDAAGEVMATVSLSGVEHVAGLDGSPSPASLLFNAYSNVVDFNALTDHGSAAIDALYRAGRLDNMYDAMGGDDIVTLVPDGTQLVTGVRFSNANAFDAGYGHDVITGSAGVDRIDGNYGEDLLFGMGGNDLLWGGADADFIDGGTGDDTMRGGSGNDTYVVDSANDRVIEDYYDGIDTVLASTTFTLGAYIENLTLTGAEAINGTGNGFDNVITGNDAANILNGLAGNDRIDGGLGADTMRGGTGDDTYWVDDSGDVIVEGSGNGTETVYSRISFTLPTNVDYLYLEGSRNISGYGNDLYNQIYGNAGDNILDGGAGDDYLVGGAGNDTYYVDAADTTSERADGGYDTVVSSIDHRLQSYLEKLILTGTGALQGFGNELDNRIIGNAGNNYLDGVAGADRMVGGQGDDIFIVDDLGDLAVENGVNGGTDLVRSAVTFTLQKNVENLELTGYYAINGFGNSLDNRLIGNSGANTLNGYGGADYMAGGAGEDTYIVDNVGDIVDETNGNGIDLVKARVSFTLSDGVENLTLTGTAAIDGTGNGTDNILIGNSANNLLDGGQGWDTMRGGQGSDTYVVDAWGDQVIEYAGEGTDAVMAYVDYTLGTHVENLFLLGYYDLAGTDNAGDNRISGNIGINLLRGLGGNDIILGNDGNDIVYGDGGNDKLFGGAGTDVLTGGAGADEFAFVDGDMGGRTWDTADRITDFDQEEGDIIRLAPMDADTTTSGNQAFTFIGSDAFSGTAGELRYETVNGATLVFGDTYGDGTSDFMIRIGGEWILGADDFVL
ncbi:hypothetical protein K3172_03085 [Qipengyuania sp. 6B39]|uniref:calcium-binding protein n=1 Tax=Qipengyuania proteolytica TaxID=2867239 RepID=UPI001C8A0A9A|nr:calcium-binding protein [Qipengyuania proteolytica]MBX7494839.1 hypothetical protein [Qipengyuania proteolytica]